MSDDDMDDIDDIDEVPEDEEGGEGEGAGAEIENEYYNAKGMVEEDIKAAIEGFEKVVAMETTKGEWGFKALKRLTKIHFGQNNAKKLLDAFKKLMLYTDNAVTTNYSEKGINSILDAVSIGKDINLTEELFNVALASLRKQQNENMWFRTNLKLAKLFFDTNEFNKLAKTLRDLHKSCENEQGQDDKKKGSQLVDIYALQIQMYTATKDNKKLKELYHKALGIESAIVLPKIMGVIRECGGKMYMREKEWEQAQTNFFEAFKNYDDAGSPRRIQCLKYLVLANMLMLSKINPFDSTEAKPYKAEAEIVAMTNLVSAYEKDDIKSFEKILKDNKKTILDDPFMKDYIDDLLRNIRTQVLLKSLIAYTKIRIPFLGQELNIPAKEVEDLMVGLILDSKLRGRIDQVSQVLELDASKGSHFWKYRAVDKWAQQLGVLNNTVLQRLA